MSKFSHFAVKKLFQAEFQQYKWKSWSYYPQINFDKTYFGGFVGGFVLVFMSAGLCSRTEDYGALLCGHGSHTDCLHFTVIQQSYWGIWLCKTSG